MVNDEKKRKVLPNGIEIEQMNDYETDFIYNEIFEEKVYYKHDIILKEDSCIFDIGANIGLFSLYNLLNAKHAKVYAFEPSPRLCNMIRYNTRDYTERIKVFQCGVSNEEGNAVFSFYPGYSIISGFKTDNNEDLRTIKSGLMGNEAPKDDFEEQCINEMLEAKLGAKEEYDCPLRTVSSIIKQENVEKIDLLKIDAEKSELEILAGIEDQDWDKIMQLIMEVHDIDNKTKKEIYDFLSSKGFEVVMDEEDELQGSGIVNIFAIKSSYKQQNKKSNKRAVSIAANFSMQPLFESLPKVAESLKVDTEFQFAEYNQVFQELLNMQSKFAKNVNGDHIIFLKLDEWLHYKKDTEDKEDRYLEQVCSQFTEAVVGFANRNTQKLWIVLCPCEENFSKLQEKQLKSMIVSAIEGIKNIVVFESSQYHEVYQVSGIYNRLSNEMGHLPYENTYYEFLSVLVLRRLLEVSMERFKAIIVDCDNTLWNGVCGEVGAKGVTVGMAEAALQMFLEKKYNEGYIIGLCSKNNEEDVWDVFNHNEQMILKKDHVVAWQINWNNKSGNLYKMANSLNIGLDSVLFIDDSPVECSEVKTNCSLVTVIEWNSKESMNLEHIWKLDKTTITTDDKKRNQSYKLNAKVNQVKEKSYTYKQFIEELNIKLQVSPVSDENIERAAQLTQRTNQFNTTTIRRDVVMMERLLKEGKEAYAVSVQDKFGDYGITGLLIMEEQQESMVLETFLLSCRVLGRGIEHKIFKWINKRLVEKHKGKLIINFNETPKNTPIREFLDKYFESFKEKCLTSSWKYTVPTEALENIEENLLESNIEVLAQNTVEPVKEIGVGAREYEEMQSFIWQHLSDEASINQLLSPQDAELKVESLQDDNQKSVMDTVKLVFAKVLNIPVEQIHEDAEIDEYIHRNSMKVVALTVELRKLYETVSPTLLYKYRTIQEIADVLTKYTPDTSKDKKAESIKIENNFSEDDIAIIGLNLRFPGADGQEEFWENLKNGICSINEMPVNRWDVDKYYEPKGGKGKYYNKNGGFLQDVDLFDASFFNISPLEAETMDPQQRIMLEIVYGLIQDAGYTPESMSRKTGVFMGVISGDYASYANQAALNGECTYRDVDYYQIANRISYYFDLNGPSIAMDTACSSSGSALYYALQSIKNGDCDSAIVGGVNLFLHPGRYIQYSQMNVLSHDGICRPFSNEASGTVYGEGAVAVLVKSLKDAIKCKDYIYGVIKGSAINSGGKSNGFTVPSPKAQADLIEKALTKYHIDPEEINYVEAHGTGTVLGDPIEIDGLTEAYKRCFERNGKNYERQYCAVGSVKSNIGHTESAATLSGLAKVLLQLKHGMLVPTLNIGQLNEYIPFNESPFVVQQRLEEWKHVCKEKDGKTVVLPRKAALSSFGAGGVNTHFIIEEYVKKEEKKETQEENVFIFSAPSITRLKKYIEQFISYISTHKETLPVLSYIAFTLQLGRELFEKRVAIVASDYSDLLKGLTAFYEGRDAQNVYQGTYEGTDKEVIGYEDFNISEIAKLWTKGKKIDWASHWNSRKVIRVSLPQLGFEKDHFWLEQTENHQDVQIAHKAEDILIDYMFDTLSGVSFSKELNASNPYIVDHIIDGECILPAAAYFEFLYEAFHLMNLPLESYKIENACWSSALKLNSKNITLNIQVEVKANQYKCTFWSNQNGIKQVHAVMFVMQEDSNHSIQRLEGNATTRICSNLISRDECYEILADKKYEYKPSYRVIDSIIYNDDIAFGKLQLENDWNEISFAPNIIDGAFQVVAIWARKKDKGFDGTFIPYTIDSVYLKQSICQKGLYNVVVKETSESKDSHILKYEVQILDEKQNICMSISGYYVRKIKDLMGQNILENPVLYFSSKFIQSNKQPINTKLSRDMIIWDQDELLYQALKKSNAKQTYLIKESKKWHELLEEVCSKGIHKLDLVLFLRQDETDIRSSIKKNLEMIQDISKAIMESHELQSVKLTYLYRNTNNTDVLINRSIAATLNVVKEEIKKLQYQCIEVPNSSTIGEIAQMVEYELMLSEVAPEVAYEDNKRFIKEYAVESNEIMPVEPIHYDANKVWLITGGTGKLGYEVAMHIAKSSKDSTIILTGRSQLNESIEMKLNNLGKYSKEVAYIRADLTSPIEVSYLISDIKVRFGSLNGIVHCAGVLKDSLVINKKLEDALAVIEPKAQGTMYLDEATKEEPLDYFILFSSTSSVMPHIGQCDYAFANRFLDEYCAYRQRLSAKNQRNGQTIAINWSLWEDGGMTVGFEERKRIEKQYGIKGLKTEDGMHLLDLILQGKFNQIGIIIGDQRKIEDIFDGLNHIQIENQDERPNKITYHENVQPVNQEQAICEIIKEAIHQVIKLAPEKMSHKDSFGKFGFDSITFTTLANELGNALETSVSPAVFYEYTTIIELAKYFAKIVKNNMPSRLMTQEDEVIEIEQPIADDLEANYDESDIAIIGMSGRFPGADSVKALWKNILNKECAISTIPKDRWDWEAYYGTKQNQTEIHHGGFIDDVATFDPEFFGISPKEALYMDPQQRLFLQTAWQCIEDAGYNPRELAGSDTGVFVGASINDYNEVIKDSKAPIDPFLSSGVNNSIIANRVSYFLDLHGASEVIDTACSSSIVCLKHAIESIRNGESTSAIVGGVNIIARPKFYISFGKAGMLSKKGKCSTFDQEADGYTRGEGVGAIYVKKLKDAIQSGDHIYAVVKGISENHGGKSHSLTAPNTKAQAQLIQSAYVSTGVDANKVDYIECHGTGTALGDPIEINGLKEAFSALNVKNDQHCILGALKANIGHLECASGIAGLIKTSLVLSHKVVPGSVNFKTLNPYIDLKDSPFKVVTENTELGEKIFNERPRPLYAGISAFGFGGTNAHAVLEEFCYKDQKRNTPDGPYAFVLSAKSQKSLKQMAKQMTTYLKGNKQDLLGDIAYTLQLGREAMKERLAVVATDLNQLNERLNQFIEDSGNNIGYYTGTAIEDDQMQPISTDKNVDELARLWVNGQDIDWKALYAGYEMKRCALPVYAFEKKSFWFDLNEADGNEKVYLKTFDGNEYYLRDHIINGKKVLPGVVQMNIVHEVVKTLFGKKVTGFENIFYPVMLTVDAKCTIKYCIKENQSKYDFKVYKVQENEEELLCAQGTALTDEVTNENIPLNLMEINESMNHVLNKQNFYEKYTRGNLKVKDTFQVLDRVAFNQTEILAQMSVSEEQKPFFENQYIYSAFYDGALQSTAVLTGYFSENADEYLPFYFKSVDVYDQLSPICYAYIHEKQQTKDSRIFDVYLTDSYGRKLVVFHDYCARRLNKESDNKLFLVDEAMEKKYIEHDRAGYSRILIIDSNEEMPQMLNAKMAEGSNIQVKGIKPEELKNLNFIKQYDPDCVIYNFSNLINKSFEKTLDDVKQWVFGLQREMCLMMKEKEILTLYLVAENNESMLQNEEAEKAALLEALSGFAKTMGYEYRNKYQKVIQVPYGLSCEKYTQIIIDEISCLDSYEVKYIPEGRYITSLKVSEAIKPRQEIDQLIKEDGVYLVTGGMGEIGNILIQKLLHVGKRIQVIATGRSPFSETIRHKIEKFEKGDSKVTYIQADISKKEDTEQLIKLICNQFNTIHGIFHCAGVLKDALLVNKTDVDIETVLNVKIKGIHYLDQFTQDCKLDFLILFSSVSGFAGNGGQTDYAYANRFIDSFATKRKKYVEKGLKNGKTIAIAWPFWKDGGMKMSAESLTFIENNTGMAPLDKDIALEALDICVTSQSSWKGVVYGKSEKVHHWIDTINHPVIRKAIVHKKSNSKDNKQVFMEKVVKMLASMLGVSEKDLLSDKKFDELGMNSFLYVDLSNQMNTMFGIDTLPSIFFEFSSVTQLVDCIWDEFGENIHCQEDENKSLEYSELQMDNLEDQMITYEVPEAREQVRRDLPSEDPIVIVGMDVLLPGSCDAKAYWNRLVNQEDMINEIPQERINLMGNSENLDNFLMEACQKRGGFLENIDGFDAEFFRISKKEADYMDPQQRLILQSAWKTIEDAGYKASELSGTQTGVYIGVAGHDYYDVIKDSNKAMDAYMLTGNMATFAANRISYLMNLHGPSEIIDTACSSSLIAFEHAIKDIRLGKITAAIVGGVNVLTNRRYYEATVDSSVLANDGRCKTLDSSANGYVRSEGVGTFLIKKLSDALKGNDHIYGIVREVGVNHGGHTSSLTAPSETSQKDLIVSTYKNANIPFNTVGYIEMHGTGTKLGDPIEFSALKRACTELVDQDLSLTKPSQIGLSAAKTTLGHLEAAAGVASIAKALLSIKHRKITGNINFKELNPYIRLENTPFYVVKENQSWEVLQDRNGNKLPRRVGINSFGMGGSNAHAIVEEYMEDRERNSRHLKEDKQIFVISAKKDEVLHTYAENIYDFLSSEDSSQIELSDIAYTLCVGREEMEKRFACVADSKETLMKCLQAFIDKKMDDRKYFTNIYSQDVKALDTLETMALSWVRHETVEIQELFKNGVHKRVSLPAYPFDISKKYWILKPSTTKAQATLTILNKQWKEQTLINQQLDSKKQIIVFSANENLHKLIKGAAPRQEVIEVIPGSQFERKDANCYSINPKFTSDYEKLFQVLSNNQNEELSVVVWEWHKESHEEPVSQADSIFKLLKGTYKAKRAIRYVYCYNSTQTLDTVCHQAMIGLCKTQNIENAKFCGNVIEVTSQDGVAASQILSELDSYETEFVTYRNGKRWVQEICAKESSVSSIETLKVNGKGVYLITGGMGAIGRMLARNISEQGATVVLLGRALRNEKIYAFLNELNAQGKTIEYITCDITDKEQVQQTINNVHKQFGPITNVFHLAGIIEDQYLKYKSEETWQRVLAPKVNGILNLDQALIDEKLEQFIIFSSVAGLFGNEGQSDYAYANAFEDYYAVYRENLRKQGKRFGKTMSLAWPYWENGGMKINDEQLEMLKKSLGIQPISHTLGIQILSKCLNKEDAYYAVMYGNKESYRLMNEKGKKEKKLEAIDSFSKKQLDSNKLMTYLHELFAELFGLEVDELDNYTDFKDYGIDSIIIHKFNREIAKKIQGIPSTILFECENMNETARFIETHATDFDETLEKQKLILNQKPVEIQGSSLNQAEPEREETKDNMQEELSEDIAIIGVSGHYPKAKELSAYWKNLCEGVDCVTDVPENRWDWKSYLKEDPNKDIYCHWGGFLDGIEDFDPYVFNISPREAKLMDPQERLLLEQVWKAFEDAGCANEFLSRENGKKKKSNIGVFIGATSETYSYRVIDATKGQSTQYSATSPWSIANRISYTFGFNGPSFSVDTACSSGLVAVKLACDSLKNKECKIAVVGGVNIYSHPYKYAHMGSTGMLSKTGHCYSFGTKADGFVPGEGIGVLILKPLKQAQKDCDSIWGVIKGSAINHGVSANGFSVPNPIAQADVIQKAIENAKLEAEDISYIEAHGTGTKLGDPIEMEGLEKVFGKNNDMNKTHYIGSVKSNIGHLESAAGVAAITKVLLQFKHKMLVPSILADTLNENIDFTHSAFKIQRTLEPWNNPYKVVNGEKVYVPRTAGVSSFGVGGTNTHVILQEYQNHEVESDNSQVYAMPQIFVLSAEDKETLKSYAAEIMTYLEEAKHKSKEESLSAQPLSLEEVEKDLFTLISKHFEISISDCCSTDTLSDYTTDYMQIKRFNEALYLQYAVKIDEVALKEMAIEEIVKNICSHKGNCITGKREDKKWLASVCYTLQRGRVELDERLGFVVNNVDECITALRKFIENDEENNNIYYAHAKRNNLAVDLKLSYEDIVQQWTMGAKVDWTQLHSEIPNRLTDIPHYPFNNQAFWINMQPASVQYKEEPKVLTSKKPEPLKLKMNQNKKEPEGAIHRGEKVKLAIKPKLKTNEISYSSTTQQKANSIPEKRKEEHFMKREDALNSIKKILGDVLYMDTARIDSSKAFIDLGLDSILGVEFVNQLNKEFDLKVRVTRIYDYPSVEEFADYICSQPIAKQESENKYHVEIVNKDVAKKVTVNEAFTKEDVVKKEPKKKEVLKLTTPILKQEHVKVEQERVKEEKVEKVSEVVEKVSDNNCNEIAIIGMSLRTPGAENTEEFWKLISKGKCAVADVPKERWDINKYYDPTGTQKDKSYCKKAGCLKDIDQFDPLFFHISPTDAKNIEPQQRMFLEEAWKTFENAGYSKEALDDVNCGVYVGVASINEYNPTNMFNTSSILASRIAYFLNLKGPALAIDTACSSSMVAIHMACNSLLNGEADMMLAGGVSIYLTENLFIQMSQAGMLSKDGTCRPFSDDASGFIPGEAVGTVLLKRLDKAIQDKDNILAVIKASGAKQDGRTNGITAPSTKAQKQLEISVYEKAKLNPEKITMIEAHGTGTNLGDPIEFEALNDCYSMFTPNKNYCALGSVKANVGHTAAAAGVVSLIKTVLCMNKKQLPPQINFTNINHNIDIKDSPFYINQRLKSWEADEEDKRYAAISSFGFSGTNVHLIVENYNAPQKASKTVLSKPYYLICLSADSITSLHYRIDDLVTMLDHNDDVNLEDLSYSLMKCRSHMNYRIALVVRDMEQLKNKLTEIVCEGVRGKLIQMENNPTMELLKPMMKELGKSLVHEVSYDALSDTEYYDKLQALANMYMISANFPYDKILEGSACSKMRLPNYRFAHKSYWHEDEKVEEKVKVEMPVKESVACSESKMTKIKLDIKKHNNTGSHGATSSNQLKLKGKKKESSNEKPSEIAKPSMKLSESIEMNHKKKSQEVHKREKFTKDMILNELMHSSKVKEPKKPDEKQEQKQVKKDDILSMLKQMM